MSEMISNSASAAESEAAFSASRPRWGRIIAWTVLLALLAIIGLALFSNYKEPVGLGSRSPNFVLTTFEGQTISTDSLKGKVVVVNFWASWCKPCEQEAADLEAAWRFYQPRGDVVFLGVNYVDTEPEAKAYLQKFDITYPNGPDLRTRISTAFRLVGVPETYFINQDGMIVHKEVGPFARLDDIKAIIDPMLTDQ